MKYLDLKKNNKWIKTLTNKLNLSKNYISLVNMVSTGKL